jgi:hypothetical protein
MTLKGGSGVACLPACLSMSSTSILPFIVANFTRYEGDVNRGRYWCIEMGCFETGRKWTMQEFLDDSGPLTVSYTMGMSFNHQPLWLGC